MYVTDNGLRGEIGNGSSPNGKNRGDEQSWNHWATLSDMSSDMTWVAGWECGGWGEWGYWDTNQRCSSDFTGLSWVLFRVVKTEESRLLLSSSLIPCLAFLKQWNYTYMCLLRCFLFLVTVKQVNYSLQFFLFLSPDMLLRPTSPPSNLLSFTFMRHNDCIPQW